jgi:hypothetical protein
MVCGYGLQKGVLGIDQRSQQQMAEGELFTPSRNERRLEVVIYFDLQFIAIGYTGKLSKSLYGR